MFSGVKPFIISDTFDDCRASSVINQETWAAINQNCQTFCDTVSIDNPLSGSPYQEKNSDSLENQ